MSELRRRGYRPGPELTCRAVGGCAAAVVEPRDLSAAPARPVRSSAAHGRDARQGARSEFGGRHSVAATQEPPGLLGHLSRKRWLDPDRAKQLLESPALSRLPGVPTWPDVPLPAVRRRCVWPPSHRGGAARPSASHLPPRSPRARQAMATHSRSTTRNDRSCRGRLGCSAGRHGRCPGFRLAGPDAPRASQPQARSGRRA